MEPRRRSTFSMDLRQARLLRARSGGAHCLGSGAALIIGDKARRRSCRCRRSARHAHDLIEMTVAIVCTFYTATGRAFAQKRPHRPSFRWSQKNISRAFSGRSLLTRSIRFFREATLDTMGARHDARVDSSVGQGSQANRSKRPIDEKQVFLSGFC